MIWRVQLFLYQSHLKYESEFFFKVVYIYDVPEIIIKQSNGYLIT